MTKIVAPLTNCWQAFWACMLDLPLSLVAQCSTEHDDWREATDRLLERFDKFYVEIAPHAMTLLADGALVGASVNGATLPHIVVARAHRLERTKDGMYRQCFEVAHDPSQRSREGLEIEPTRIVLICQLSRK